MPNSPGTSLSSVPLGAAAAMSVTSGSSLGSMPRTSVPFMSSPRAISAWVAMKGAAPTTSGCLRAAAMMVSSSGRAWPSREMISMCETTPSMRSRTSFWKPFITLSTMISAATPSAMPSIDTPEMNEMKPLRRVARPARV